jgi:uncharacterized protein YidB (DUF937 family)
MGLMDILNGMQNGPRGQRQPSSNKESGGMSPLMMALLGLLAYKAMKHLGGGGQASARPTPAPPSGQIPSRQATGGQGSQGGGSLGDLLGGNQIGRAQAGGAGGGLGDLLGGLFGGRGGTPGARAGGGLDDLLRGGLGGLLGGAAAGTVLGGGLDELLKGFQQSGHAREAQSWVSRGTNEEIAPGDLEAALGGDTLDALVQQTGMDRDELLRGLSQQLPDFVDQLTPDGRMPTEDEWSRMV